MNYVNTYIKRNQCGAPDTHFIKEDRTTLLKCQACGSRAAGQIDQRRCSAKAAAASTSSGKVHHVASG